MQTKIQLVMQWTRHSGAIGGSGLDKLLTGWHRRIAVLCKKTCCIGRSASVGGR